MYFYFIILRLSLILNIIRVSAEKLSMNTFKHLLMRSRAPASTEMTVVPSPLHVSLYILSGTLYFDNLWAIHNYLFLKRKLANQNIFVRFIKVTAFSMIILLK